MTGRSSPRPAIIAAVSQEPDFTGFEEFIEGRDWIKVDDFGATKVDGVWAGGDVTNLDLVTTAIGHGRRAAEAIDRKFKGVEFEPDKMQVIKTDLMHLEHYEAKTRVEPKTLGVDERMTGDVNTEVNLGFTQEQAIAETQRCMSCGFCFDCERCWMYCQDQAINKPMEKGIGNLYTFNLDKCTGCKKCAEICPCGFIEMQ